MTDRQKPLSGLSQPHPAASPAAAARCYKTLARIEKLERRLIRCATARQRWGYEPRRVFRPDLEALKQLRNEIAGLPKRRRLRAEQARSLLKQIERLVRRQRRVETLLFRALRQQDQIRYRGYIGNVVLRKLETPDGLDRLLEWLIWRKGLAGQNPHAVALALKRSVMLPPGQLAEWGRKGAQARWAKREPPVIGDEPTSRRAASSLNEAPVSEAHE
jgi:hypothetical protein